MSHALKTPRLGALLRAEGDFPRLSGQKLHALLVRRFETQRQAGLRHLPAQRGIAR